MFRLSKNQEFLGVVFGVVICVAMTAILSSCGGFGSSQTPSSNWYLHWSCGNHSQCASDFGSYYGVWQSYSTQAACQGQLNNWASQNIMQPYSSGIGAWCDTNSAPATVPSSAKRSLKSGHTGM
jgi:hypothetical protein